MSEGSFLEGVRVLELADELGEYSGKVLAGLGADVIKVEPPGGESTRTYGPFAGDDPHPNRSLYFWHYNFGKRGIVLDLDGSSGQEQLRSLVRSADVVIDTRPRGALDDRGVGYSALSALNPRLIYVRISPFGDDGPWADLHACDLVHLALGGVAMNCGYDPDPEGHYETPPVAPQMWQAYHIAGEMAAIGVVGALNHRLESGVGQHVAVSVHQAVACNTETDVPNWVYQRREHHRQTARHSMPTISLPALARTKDGRWLLPYRTYLPPSFGDPFDGTVRLLQRHGMAEDLHEERYRDAVYRNTEAVSLYIGAVTDALVERMLYDRDLWREAQEEGLPWAPCRRPEENLDDEHWRVRHAFFSVEHPDLEETFDYVGGKWFCREVPWPRGPRAPLLGEHTDAVLADLTSRPLEPIAGGAAQSAPSSPRGAPFALNGVRVIELSWLLASAGAGRFLASMGAEVIKVEHVSRIDAMRFGVALAPEGGRAERDAATDAINTPESESVNRSGAFMEINAGKLGLSLNLKSDRGRELLTGLIAGADMIVEGFSPGTMERMGFGYERLKEINPRIIYVQQSGMGQAGTYGRLRSYGPTAAAFTGLTEMSGLPDPFPPAGIGYSYLDWFGAYNMGLAMLVALYRQRATGEGCWIDASQAEAGNYLTGTSILDASVNGRGWRRYGNRSPYKPAAPHGIYPAAGEDHWLAIACFTDEQWRGLLSVIGDGELGEDPRFRTLEGRLKHQDALDDLMGGLTRGWERFALMNALQAAGVPSGVCQTARDRCDADPQLSHLGWTIELEQEEIGTWPVKETPIHFSRTPTYIGGSRDRHGPSYGQDTDELLKRLLDLDEAEIEQLHAEGVV